LYILSLIVYFKIILGHASLDSTGIDIFPLYLFCNPPVLTVHEMFYAFSLRTNVRKQIVWRLEVSGYFTGIPFYRMQTSNPWNEGWVTRGIERRRGMYANTDKLGIVVVERVDTFIRRPKSKRLDELLKGFHGSGEMEVLSARFSNIKTDLKSSYWLILAQGLILFCKIFWSISL